MNTAAGVVVCYTGVRFNDREAKMSRLIVAALVASCLVVSAKSYAADANGNYIRYGAPTCGQYLDAYSSAELTGKWTALTTDPITANALGWISGFVSAYNRYVDNERQSILGDMSLNDARGWMASWCRDNPSKYADEAAHAFIESHLKK